MTKLDYYNVQPHITAILPTTPQRYNTNRGGKKIRYITRHHTAGKLDAVGINRVWATRQASAHYLADFNGFISQHVWDAHTAWSNANLTSNQETISIEHSNSAGADQDWPIDEKTIIAGARWAAALCLYYKLGRPEFGKNIRDHKEFTSTGCPHHLARGGKYHAKWMAEAQSFYDQLAAKKVNKDGTPKTTATPAPPKKEAATVTDFDKITRQYNSRVKGSKVTMTPMAALLNIDAHAWTTLQIANQQQQQLDRIEKMLKELTNK